MIQTRLFSAALLMAGLAQASAALAAAPNVIINQGQANACTVTPNSGTVFTLDSSGNVLVNGTYGATCPTSGGTGGSGDPTFSFNPNPANLTIPGGSLTSAGGTVNPNFVAYFANTCTGSVSATTGCAAVTGNWAGGTVCTKASGTTYCTPGSAAVTIPANTAATACTYTFQAVNCTNGTTSVNSAQANVTVAANTGGGGGTYTCTANDVGELNSYGYTRQCGGTIHSFVAGLSPYWDNSYKGVMSNVDWPGNTAQHGKGISVTVNANQYASFGFNTGTVASGASFQTNPSYGTVGLISVSTTPGDFFSGTAVCVGSSLTISSKTNTVASTNCKLAQNTVYYINFSSASYSAPHDTVCTSGSCATGWIWYLYGN